MKLVIDIDDELYKAICDCDRPQILSHWAIKNGTPLPKGHGRLIDGDILHKNFEDRCMSWEAKLIDHAPTIIEADKKEGERNDQNLEDMIDSVGGIFNFALCVIIAGILTSAVMMFLASVFMLCVKVR